MDTTDNRAATQFELDMFAMQAPLYRSYNVTAINNFGRNADVEMGISGDKIEITPIHSKGFFQWQPKAATVNDEDVVLCELLSHKLSMTIFISNSCC